MLKAACALFVSASLWSLAEAAPPVAPALQNPAEAAVLQPVNLTLAWAAAATATSYHVQVSEEADFDPLVVNSENITELYRLSGPFKNKTTFHWRVRAKNADGFGAYSAVRTFTTIDAVPAVPVQVAPAAAALDVALSPVLLWRKAAGAASYHLQVSTRADFNTTVHDDAAHADTSAAVGPLSVSTAYHWRVRARNPGGTSAWSAVRIFTTVPAVPAVPVLAAPAQEAAQVALPATLDWNRSDRAANYRLQVSTAADFAGTPALETVVKDTASAFSASTLKYNTTYHWRVRAENAGGNSAYSAARTFSTLETPPVPALVSPAEAAVDLAVNARLVWRKTSRAVTYKLQVSKVADFATLVHNDSALTDTGAVPGLENKTTYYWRVRAKNAAGVSAYSAARKFTTIVLLPPPAPALSSPADGATGLATNPTLRWTASERAVSYHVQVSTSASFATTVFNDASVTGTSRQVTSLPNSGLFYWRVLAKNASGESAYSPIWSFTTQVGTVAEPVPVSPADNAERQPRTVAIKWRKALNASSYRLQVSAQSDFSATVHDDSALADTVAEVGPLTHGAAYYWRVRGKNAAGVSDYSDARKFTVVSEVPAAPGLDSPADNAEDQKLTLTLTWDKAPRAIGYRLQVATTAGFGTLYLEDTALTDTSRQLTSLKAGTQYFWRVRARGEGGLGDWSAIRAFKTEPGVGLVRMDRARGQGLIVSGLELGFALEQASEVKVTLINPINGKTAVLYRGSAEAGSHRIESGALPKAGSLYLVRMTAGKFSETRRWIAASR